MLLGEQLRRSRGDVCQPLGIQGARRALFKITLTSHGYTVVSKGTGTIPSDASKRPNLSCELLMRTISDVHFVRG